jgi:hypothetical protein
MVMISHPVHLDKPVLYAKYDHPLLMQESSEATD